MGGPVALARRMQAEERADRRMPAPMAGDLGGVGTGQEAHR
jgi:hypothetical protein